MQMSLASSAWLGNLVYAWCTKGSLRTSSHSVTEENIPQLANMIEHTCTCCTVSVQSLCVWVCSIHDDVHVCYMHVCVTSMLHVRVCTCMCASRVCMQVSSGCQITSPIYCSSIRPPLEYVVIVWNLTLKGDLTQECPEICLEVCMKSWNSTYEELLTSAKLPSLQDRCTEASLPSVYSTICLKS